MIELEETKEKLNLNKALGFAIISGLIEFMVIILVNMTLFLISLFYYPSALPYVLGFFIISYVGRIIWRKS